MRTYHSNEIGNVVVLGHSGSGKTSVIEAMAYRAGITKRIGTVQDGNTLSDYSPEEIKRQTSIGLSVIPLEWNECKINILMEQNKPCIKPMIKQKWFILVV